MNIHRIMAKFQRDQGVDIEVAHIELIQKSISGIYNLWNGVVGRGGRKRILGIDQ